MPLRRDLRTVAFVVGLALLSNVAGAAEKLPEHNTIIPGPWQTTPAAEQRKQAALADAARAAAEVTAHGATPATAAPLPAAVSNARIAAGVPNSPFPLVKPGAISTVGAISSPGAPAEPRTNPASVPAMLPAAELVPRERFMTVGPAVLNDNERRKLRELDSTPAAEKRE